MKKPKLLRVIGIAGLAIAAVGIATFLVVQSGKNTDTRQPASQPVAALQSAEQITTLQQSYSNFNQVVAAANNTDYPKTVALSYAYATNTANDTETRLDSFRVCLQAAILAKDTIKKDDCYQQGKALANTVVNQADKDSWLKMFEATYNGTTQTPQEVTNDKNQ